MTFLEYKALHRELMSTLKYQALHREFILVRNEIGKARKWCHINHENEHRLFVRYLLLKNQLAEERLNWMAVIKRKK